MSKAVQGSIVRVHYTGTLDDGEIFDSSKDRSPLQFIIGEGRLLKPFEDTVVGMAPGESRKVTIPPENAYGLHRKEMVMVVERNKLPSNIVPEVGMRLEIALDSRSNVMVEITEINGKEITLDANHPLAGKTITFEIQLVEIF
ncbi:MAG: peptidylprolyl isomerase [Candidatus Xenobiia bacterium LiM19]